MRCVYKSSPYPRQRFIYQKIGADLCVFVVQSVSIDIIRENEALVISAYDDVLFGLSIIIDAASFQCCQAGFQCCQAGFQCWQRDAGTSFRCLKNAVPAAAGCC